MNIIELFQVILFVQKKQQKKCGGILGKLCEVKLGSP